MQKLDHKTEYSWDEIIEKRQAIKEFADKLDVNQDYLLTQTNFLKGVTLNNKNLSISAINKAIDRLNEIG